MPTRQTDRPGERRRRFVPPAEAPLPIPSGALPDLTYEPVEDLSVETTPDGLIVLHQNGERLCMRPNQAAMWADLVRDAARRAGAIA